MTINSLRKIAVWVFACAFCVVIVGILISFLCPDVMLLNLPDKSVQFKFAVITHGTNHVIFLGNPAVARLRWLGFFQPRLRPLSQLLPKSIKADWIETDTAANKRLLWVAFGDQPLYMHCSITNSFGHHLELRSGRSFASSSRLTGLNIQAFELPVALGKRKGYTVRVYGLGTFEQENELATLQLR